MPYCSSVLLSCAVLVAAPTLLPAAEPGTAAPKFELRDGDRVVFLGNTLIEREQQYGHWETMLTARWPDRNVTFRNLGWDGDTVWAESRGIFDAPETGYQRMLDHVKSLKPAVIFLGYGGNEAFAGTEGLPRFIEQYNKLLDDLTKVSPAGVRFVMLTPVPVFRARPELPDPAPQNQRLRHYAQALVELAAERGIPLIDLYAALERDRTASSLSDGVHLTDKGYRTTARLFVSGAERQTSVGGHDEERLRQAIVAKNELYFHHWRPQNITYLFGFRKHEQGQNAKEVEEFEKLVAAKEAEIAKLRVPVTATQR